MALPRWIDNPPVWPDAVPEGSGRAWLAAWASIHCDMLFVELFLADDAMECLDILNRLTELDIKPEEPIDSSCKLFLRELEKHRCEHLRIHG
ncbi:hypothetical protein VPZ60_004229 [Salmonella enterica]|nr:hypothetical protein [Salmonella enterica]